MSIQPGTHKIGSARFEGRKKYARATYSFADDGGAVSDITLTTTPVIPSGALVTNAHVDVTTAPTSGGAATIALKVEGAGDLDPATAISAAPWSATGVKNLDIAGVDKGAKTTAARSVVATVGTAALTAGAFDVVVEYMELA